MRNNKREGKKSRRIGLYIFLSILLVILILVGTYAIIWHSRSTYVYDNNYVWASTDQFDLDLYPSLVIDEDAQSLKVLQIADPQLKFTNINSRDIRTMELLGLALDKEQPDIAVCTGDLTLSIFTHHAYKKFADFMEKRQQYWTVTFGNHDSEFDSNKDTLTKLLADYEYCLYTPGPNNIKGVSNFLINVYKGEANKAAGNVAYSLVMIDSNMYPVEDNALTTWVYDWIGEDQVAWYEWAIKGLQAKKADIQTSMYFHIPTVEMAQMYYSHQLSMGNSIPSQIDTATLLPTRDVYGTVGESNKDDEELVDPGYNVGIFYQGSNTGIYDKAVELGSTKIIMSGHDHVNTLRGYYGTEGSEIYLGYGVCCGYHTYPYFETDNFLLRLFNLSDKPLYNMSVVKDHDGNSLQKGFTTITIDMTDAQYGQFAMTNTYHSAYKAG